LPDRDPRIAAEARWTIALDAAHPPPSKQEIGGKAHSIAQLVALGLPTPPAVVITTKACVAYLRDNALPEGLAAELAEAVAHLERVSGRRFAEGEQPLLLSVRSGAAISMPGMMDTVLNLGINDRTEAALAQETGNAAFARDTHRRFHQMYAKTVLKAPEPDLPPDADPETWRSIIQDVSGQTVPEDPMQQLHRTVEAVFKSWNNRRARRYRRHHGIDDAMGTAVTLQMMVFGNLGPQSGTGVLFSRDPLTGAPQPYGQYLANAQGEDVVSGAVTPEPLSALNQRLPQVHQALLDAGRQLEHRFREVQDIEFTVQAGHLYLLQARTAKRSPRAAVAFAVAMAEDGLIDRSEALRRVTPEQVRSLLRSHLADGAADRADKLAEGEAACSGVGIGLAVRDPDEAERRAEAGEAVILVRPSTSPDEVHAMALAQAVITERGGGTSHAAVVCRSLGVPCVVGCGADALSDLHGKTLTADGKSGSVFLGALPVVEPKEQEDAALTTLISWARPLSPLRVVADPDAAGAPVTDLSSLPGSEDPDRLSERLAGLRVVSGGAVATDAGVRAALAAGVKTIVAEPVLPVLLAAIHAAAEQAKASD